MMTMAEVQLEQCFVNGKWYSYERQHYFAHRTYTTTGAM